MEEVSVQSTSVWPIVWAISQDNPALIWVTLLAALIALNLLTYLLFKIDKARAIAGTWLISESTLLTCAFLGGSVGAKRAQRRFRHKTRKEPFRSTLNFICMLHVLALLAGVLWVLGYWPAILRWIA